jgi:cyclopropane fatty-acyl-phospholipid synthase-like methyltransferase
MSSFRENSYGRYETFAKPDYAQYTAAYSRRLESRLVVPANAKCLDVACGFGNFLAFLQHKKVASFVGVDGSAPAIKAVQEEFGVNAGVCDDIFNFLKENQECFDLVSALDFLEHLQKQELHTFLGLIHKHLVAGGRLLVRVPNAAAPFGMASRYNDITHEICFTPNALRDVFMTHGFRTIAIWEDTGSPTSVAQFTHRAFWESARFFIRLLDMAETGSRGDGVFTRNMWALAERA